MDLEKLNTIALLAKEIEESSTGHIKEKAEHIKKIALELIKEIEKLLILEMYL